MRSRILFALLIQIIISVAGAWQLPEVSAQPTPTELKELSIFFRRPSALQLLLNRLFPTDTINPSFAWARLPRYGLDKNRNDIIDLPNSFDYAHNLPSWDRSGCECFQGDCSNGGAQFRVMFDASGTFFPPTSARTDNPAVILPGNPWHTAEEAAFHAGRLQARMRQLEWRIEGEPLRQAMTGNIQYAPPYTYETCLPEGTYTVTLRALDNYTNEWRDFQRSVSVEDILIVQLGDSYGSGEGNPEKVIRATVRVGNDSYKARAEAMLHAMHHPNVQYVLWADDGQPQEWIETEASALLSLGQTPVLARMTARVPNFERFSEIHRDHYRSHRSSFTASSQLAIELENDNKKSSVTYINLAMSGATTNDGVLGSYAGVPVARFYGNYMGNQLKQLQDIVGNRRIDMLIMSIGGNDAGFAHSAAGLVAREESYGPGGAHFGVNFEKISRGVRTGKWAEVEDSTGFFAWNLTWSDTTGLNSLAGQLEQIRQQMQAFKLNVGQVYVTQYPNFGKRYFPEIAAPGGTMPAHVGYCEQILNSIAPNAAPGGLEINSVELQWATVNVLNPLNDIIQNFAHDKGWIFVDRIVEIIEPHGVCAWAPYEPEDYTPSHPVPDRLHEPMMRWFRREREASVIQNLALDKATLTLHPNEYGHKAIKNRLLEVVVRPNIQD